MKSKKLVLAVFLGLLASAAALISSLFMLYQLKTLSTLPMQVDNLSKVVQSINTEIDVSPLSTRIDEIVQNVIDLGTDVENLKATGNATPTTPEAEPTTPAEPTPPASTPTTEPVKPKPETDTSSKPPTEDGKTTTDRLNIRSNPGLKSQVIRTSKTGEKLKPLGEQQVKDGHTWIKVQDSNGKIGWVAQKYTN